MGVLLAFITFAVVVVASVVLAISTYARKTWLRDFVIGGVTVWMVFYFAMLIGFSLASEEKELGLHEPKEFCGFYLDCHMHTAVTDVRNARTIGNRSANGEFYIVKVRVFSNAKKATLAFGGLELHVIDADGRLYPPSPATGPPKAWFTRPVPAGDSFEQDVVFDLPADVKGPRLEMRDDQRLIEKFLIGDEDSIFHKRAYFKLENRSADIHVRK